MNKTRELFDNKLGTYMYKHKCMKRKLLVDSQCPGGTDIEKRMAHQMDNFEKQYSETISKISSNMDKIAN